MPASGVPQGTSGVQVTSEHHDAFDTTDRPVSYAAANGIEIAYETFGDPVDPPLVLVMGLGVQMLGWPDELCASLAGSGYHVVRFDNRDVGLSTHLNHLPATSLRDLAGLLDALPFQSAHIVGASMGGFISQTLAIRRPDLVRSLTLIMTSTGSRRVGQPRPRVMRAVLRKRNAADREAAVSATVETFRAIGSPGYPFEEARIRDAASRSYDRAFEPDGQRRQLAAAATQHNRTYDLTRLQVPTVIVHGLDDPLVAFSGGLALAKAIPHAKFVGFPGMGHDLPRELWSEIEAEIVRVAQRADPA
jgi:pimeloyl-ACP methyl ester carboxylesterase